MAFMIPLVLLWSLIVVPSCSGAENVWGTYRPNIYFGVKAKAPRSPQFGVMWYNPAQSQPFQNILHDCSDTHGFSQFGWFEHNGHDYGKQVIEDTKNEVRLTSYFVGFQEEGGQESWVLTLEGKNLPSKKKPSISMIGVMYYWTLDDTSHTLDLDTTSEQVPVISMDLQELGQYQMKTVVESTKVDHTSFQTTHSDLEQIYYRGYDNSDVLILNEDYEDQDLSNRRFLNFWDVKRLIQAHLGHKHNIHKQNARSQFLKSNPETPVPEFRILTVLDNITRKKSRILILQKLLPLNFKMKFFMFPQTNNFPTRDIENVIRERSTQFHLTFLHNFPMLFKTEFQESLEEMSKYAVSNLVGSTGYFDGSWLKLVNSAQFEKQIPAQLLSGVPSRSFFPRGFLWDEGFHLLISSKMRPSLALEIVEYWLNMADPNGWIPREQILGSEARSRVPSEFQVQNDKIANPPTFALSVVDILKKLSSDGMSYSAVFDFEGIDASDGFTGIGSETAPIQSQDSIYVRLKQHALWYFNTLANDDGQSFNWGDRTEDHCLSSGLDDFPRGELSFEFEANVDLQVWMIALSRSMSSLATMFGQEDDSRFFLNQQNILTDTLIRIFVQLNFSHALGEFWSDETKGFHDYSMNITSQVVNKTFAKHIGYITFLPLMLHVLPPDSIHLLDLLNLLKDPSHCWSQFGIRSLSKSSELFGTKENYWRGPIWMNMNYLILRGLWYYGWEVDSFHRERFRETYHELKTFVVSNVLSEWRRTGFLWEQYGEEGNGQRCRPFTGWTSLISLILGDQYQ